MKSVVVTGVSTGIGWGITKILTKNGVHFLAVSARLKTATASNPSLATSSRPFCLM